MEIVRRLYAADPTNRFAATSLMTAMTAVGPEDEALEFARSFLATNRGTAHLWSSYSQLVHNRGDLATARKAMDSAIDEAKKEGAVPVGYWTRQAGLYLAADEVATLMEALVAADSASPGHEYVRLYMQMSAAQQDAKEQGLRAACARRGAPAEQLERLLHTLREISGPAGTTWERVLESHLRQMAGRCRRAGAHVLFVTYPFNSASRALLQRLAAAEGCTFVPVDEAIAAAKKAEPGRELHVADGHCNDDGYGVMAARVAEAIRALPPAHK
jgi:hypothetical protein